MKEKKVTIVFFSSSFIMIFMFFSALYIYDPYQLFHKHWLREQTLKWDMRKQASGIINNFNFDSIILGTSMLENTSSKEASQLLGGEFINISVSGSNFYERSFILRYALNKKPIKKVLYSLDNISSASALEKGQNSFPVESYSYLYDYNRINDFKLYLNYRYIKCLYKFSKKSKCVGRKTDYDRPNAWYKIESERIKFGGLDNWFKEKNNPQIVAALKKISQIAQKINKGEKQAINSNNNVNVQNIKKYFEKYIISFVKQNNETEFILLIPPYSRIRWSIWAQYDLQIFRTHNLMLKYIVNESSKYSNLKIFSWNDHDFVDDIKNYKDTGHYEYKINSWMLDAIKRNEGLLTNSNIKQYIEKTTQQALDFDLIGLGKKIDVFLKKENRKKPAINTK